MGSLFRSQRPAPKDDAPRSGAKGDDRHWTALNVMPEGRAPWFDPKLEAHRRFTTYRDDEPQVSMEFPSLELLTAEVMGDRRTQQASGSHAARIDFAMLRIEGRPFDATQADRLASVLSQSRYKKLVLLVSTFQPGALRRLTDGLHRSFEMVGLAWLFSAAGIGDEASLPKEVAYLMEKGEVERLSLLSARFPAEVEQKLAQALKTVSTLKVARVYQLDQARQLTVVSTPALDSALASH